MRYFHASRPCGVVGVSFGLTGRSRGVPGLRMRAFEWIPACEMDETVSNISVIQPPHSRLWWLVLLLPAVPTLLYCCCRRRRCWLCRCRLLPEALARRSVEPEGPVVCFVVVLHPRVRRRCQVERLGLRPIEEKVACNRSPLIWRLCGGLFCVS